MPDIRPQPGPQTLFAKTKADIAIYGGAAGGGKSFWLVAEAARWTHVPGYGAALFRRTSPQLTGPGSVWEESYGLYPSLGGRPTQDPLEWRWKHPGRADSIIRFSHMQYEKDWLSHQSKQYCGIFWDQLEQFTGKQFWSMLSRNRSTCGITPHQKAAANPDPDCFLRPLLDWWIGEEGYPIEKRSAVLRWFIRDGDELVWADHAEQLVEKYKWVEPGDPLSLTFIPAKVEDNLKLLSVNPGYLARLRALPIVERERLLRGNWDIKPAAGMYFKEHWFDIVDKAPTDVVGRVRAWDRAASPPTTEKPDPDCTSGVLMSCDRNGVLYVENVKWDQVGPHGVQKMIITTAKHDGHSVEVCQWQDPAAAGKADAQTYTDLLEDLGFTVHTTPASQDKITYAMPVSAHAEALNIKLVKAPWNKRYMREMEGFPMADKDDAVDATSLAYKHVGSSDLAYLESMARWVKGRQSELITKGIL